MASSLNGLTVGDPLSDNLMDSPLRPENMMPYLRLVSFLLYTCKISKMYNTRHNHARLYALTSTCFAEVIFR